MADQPQNLGGLREALQGAQLRHAAAAVPTGPATAFLRLPVA